MKQLRRTAPATIHDAVAHQLVSKTKDFEDVLATGVVDKRAFLLVFESLQIFVQVCHPTSFVLEPLSDCVTLTLSQPFATSLELPSVSKRSVAPEVRAWHRLFVCASFNAFL